MCARLVEPYILMFVKIKNNNNILLYSWFCTIKYVFNSVTKYFEGKFTFKKDLSLTQWSQLVDCIRDCREATFGQRPRVNEPQIGRSSLEPKYNLRVGIKQFMAFITSLCHWLCFYELQQQCIVPTSERNQI